LPELLTHYTTYPLPRHVVDKFGSDWSRPGKMVSNGLCLIRVEAPRSRSAVEKHKFYDAANVKIDEVYYPDRRRPLRAQALPRWRTRHAGALARQRVQMARRQYPSETRKHTYLAIRYTSFNMTKKPFDDIRVRKRSPWRSTAT
jgi:oligopeptide transport system substrate-binding protein